MILFLIFHIFQLFSLIYYIFFVYLLHLLDTYIILQVYKLITKNSIEEKIYELQQRKAKLADSMLDTKTTFINKLSKEDIMELFE